MRVSKNFLVAVLTSLLGALVSSSSTYAGTNTPQEQANMKLVADFHEAIEQDSQQGSKRVRSIAEQFLSPDYIQHQETALSYGQGREGYIRTFEQMAALPPPAGSAAPRPPTLLTLMANGDLVVHIASRPGAAGQNPSYAFSLYRVQDGKLAEHWSGFSRQIERGTSAAAASGSGK